MQNIFRNLSGMQSITLASVFLTGVFWVFWLGWALIGAPDADFKWLLLFGLVVLAFVVSGFGSLVRHFHRRNTLAEKRRAREAAKAPKETTSITELPNPTPRPLTDLPSNYYPEQNP